MAAVAIAAMMTAAVPAAAVEDDTPDGLGITVTVIAPTPAPSGAVPVASGTAGRVTRSPAAAPAAVTTSTSPPAAAVGDVEMVRGLFLSDIAGTARPTANPFAGTSELWITIRNSSTDTVDLTADFSLATFYGARIDGSSVAVSAVKPGETRVVSTVLSGSGQWPVVVGRVVVTPPDTVAGQATAPVARAAMVWVFPWMLLTVLLLAGVATVLVRVRWSSAHAAPLAGAPA